MKLSKDQLSLVGRLGVLLVIGLVIFAIQWFVHRPHSRPGDIGPLAVSCKKVPEFAKDAGIDQPVFDTSQKNKPGLVMYDSQHPERAFQHPTWKTAGNLGPIAIDEQGNVFVAPVPNINTLTNPADKQNTIWQVDTQSGAMSEFYSLQHVVLPSQQNPYGILSLAYDCETKVLYASTISGSTAGKATGGIVAIDVQNKREIGRLRGIDALSVGLFRDKRGAQLYIGLAAKSQVWRVGIAKNGAFVGNPQQAFSYDEFNELKPRKLDFIDAKTLQIHTSEFRYNLVASTEFRQDIITYNYSDNDDSWKHNDSQDL